MLVVTLVEAVARWVAQPVELDGLNRFTPQCEVSNRRMLPIESESARQGHVSSSASWLSIRRSGSSALVTDSSAVPRLIDQDESIQLI